MHLLFLVLSLAHGAPCATHSHGQLTPEGTLNFAPSTADLVDSDEAISSLACALNADAALTLQVETHTDSRGSGSYNLRISQSRADAIRAALLEDGIDAKRVTAVGYGETRPLESNAVVEGRMQNRRIELHTEDPATRPPKPASSAPTPQPVPPRAPVDGWCSDLSAAIRNQQPAQWVRSGAVAVVADRMTTCLGTAWAPTRDGDALYAQHPEWTLVVVGGNEGVEVRLEHR